LAFNGTSDSQPTKTSEFPTLYDEARDMLDVSILTYAYAALREYAHKSPGYYTGEESILDDKPVTAKDIYTFIKDNSDVLKNEESFKGEGGEFNFKQFQAVLDDGESGNMKDADLITYNDKYFRQLFYGIILNRSGKRIVLSFRGTQSLPDMIDDIQVAGATVDNPLFGVTPNQQRTFQIHKGFYNCLFKDMEGGKTKFHFIMDQLNKVRREHPDYKLYVTGHSLGGALATLFAFFASIPAYSGYVSPFPLTCVSVASPLVGDSKWQNAFMLQEKIGRLRHLRMSNYGDIVPKVWSVGMQIPPFGLPFGMEHAGVHLQLYDDKPARLSYPTEGITPSLDKKEDKLFVPLPTFSKILDYHTTSLYSKRLDRIKQQLKSMFLDDCYADSVFVGKYTNV
jgi:hypothetical protein